MTWADVLMIVPRRRSIGRNCRSGLPSRALSTETIVHVGDLPFVAGGRHHWLRRTFQHIEGSRSVQWTDTSRCAAARAFLSSLYELEVPRPSEGGAIEVITDGVDYTLSTDASFADGRLGRLSFSAAGGTSLASWADRWMAQLEVCWSDVPPPTSWGN